MSSKPTSHLLQKVYAFSSMYLHSTHSKSGQCQATTKWTWREATYQACSKQKWSGPARLLNFLLVVWIWEQAKQVIIYLWLQGAWKVFHFLVIRKHSKAQQDTAFFSAKLSTWELTVYWLMWPVYCHGNSTCGHTGLLAMAL